MTAIQLLQEIEKLLKQASLVGEDVQVYVNDSESGCSLVDQVELSLVRKVTKDSDPSQTRLIIHSEVSE